MSCRFLLRRSLPGLLSAALLAMPAMAADGVPGVERARQIVHMVRQDCGSCHGLSLQGGLGPPLTAEALAGRPVDGLVATILHGRPGTPMPPFRHFLDEAEATWVVERLIDGFPAEVALP